MNKTILPDSQKVQKTVIKLQEVCDQFDTLNFKLDELIAQVDTEVRNSPLTLYRLKKNCEVKSG